MFMMVVIIVSDMQHDFGTDEHSSSIASDYSASVFNASYFFRMSRDILIGIVCVSSILMSRTK